MRHRLLPPVPPFVDRNDPRLIAWRMDQHETAIEHLHARKLEPPPASLLRLAWVVCCLVLGLAGAFSPHEVVQLLRALAH